MKIHLLALLILQLTDGGLCFNTGAPASRIPTWLRSMQGEESSSNNRQQRIQELRETDVLGHMYVVSEDSSRPKEEEMNGTTSNGAAWDEGAPTTKDERQEQSLLSTSMPTSNGTAEGKSGLGKQETRLSTDKKESLGETAGSANAAAANEVGKQYETICDTSSVKSNDANRDDLSTLNPTQSEGDSEETHHDSVAAKDSAAIKDVANDNELQVQDEEMTPSKSTSNGASLPVDKAKSPGIVDIAGTDAVVDVNGLEVVVTAAAPKGPDDISETSTQNETLSGLKDNKLSGAPPESLVETSNDMPDEKVDNKRGQTKKAPFFASASKTGDSEKKERKAPVVADQSVDEVQSAPPVDGSASTLFFASGDPMAQPGSDGADSGVTSKGAEDDTNNRRADLEDVNGIGAALAAKPSDEELRKQYKEYKTASMKELRENVDEAKERSSTSKERVQSMQQIVDKLRQEFEEAESEFQLYIQTRDEENDSITARVNELENLLQSKKDKAREYEDKLKSAAEKREDTLLKGIEESKAALREAEEGLKKEKEKAAQIEERLALAQEQLLKEKSAFEGDEGQLQATVENAREQMANTETRIKKEREEFEEERTNLAKELQQRITAVAETNARMQLERSMFSMNQAELQRKVDDVSSKLRRTERKLVSGEKRFVKETKALEKRAAELRDELSKAEKKLEEERKETQQAKDNLEMRLMFEVVKVKDLSTDMKHRQDTYQQEINELEQTSADIRAKLADAQAKLESTRATIAHDKQKLQDQVTDGDKIRKLKAKQMSNRYRDIRADMTAKWQGERRKARKERKRLDEKYKTRLENLRDAVPRLERNLEEARLLTEDLCERASEAKMEKAAIIKESREAESRYIQLKHERNLAISSLESEVGNLKMELSEREKKLENYQTSLRTMMGLSVKLTGKRIRATGKRLLEFVRIRKKPTPPDSNMLFKTERIPIAVVYEEEEEDDVDQEYDKEKGGNDIYQGYFAY